MKQIKRHTIYLLMVVMVLPGLLIFNDNPDTSYLNFIGIGYGLLMMWIVPKRLPRRMRDRIGKILAES